MNLDGKLPCKKDTAGVPKKEQTKEFSPEVFRQKISDPFWLPSYKEISNVVNSYTDEYGSFLLDKEKEDEWFKYIRNKENPVFEIWTKEYVDLFSNYLSKQAKLLGGTKENPKIILEVGAGDGKLSYFLTQKLKESKVDKIEIITTGYDSESFKIKSKYDNVENLSEKDALEKYNPDIVVCSWMISGEDWTPDFRKTKSVQEYILIGPDGPCGTDDTWQYYPGFKKIVHKDLSEVQISRTDFFGSRKISSVDFITKTTSFKKNK